MMPAHKMRGAPLTEDIVTVLDKIANDMMGDRDGRRRGETLGMVPAEHRRQLVAVEPACVFEFFAVDDKGVRQSLGMAADHDRGGEWPRLGGEIAYPPAYNASLFPHLAPHRFFNRFARFGETGEAGPHCGR